MSYASIFKFVTPFVYHVSTISILLKWAIEKIKEVVVDDPFNTLEYSFHMSYAFINLYNNTPLLRQ
jgi:hypothetical protein